MSVQIYSLKPEDKKFLRSEFFNTPNEKKSSCKVCKTTKEYDMGMTNSLKHIETQHKQWSELISTRAAGASSIDFYVQLIDPKSQNLHDWAEWVIMDNHPYTFVTNKYTRKNTNLEDISRNTLGPLCDAINWEVVRPKISQELPDTFGAVFDGWECGGEHYLAIFATWTKSNGSVAERLIGMVVQPPPPISTASNVVSDTGFSAEDLGDLLFDCLGEYGRDFQSIEFLSGDNVSVNKSLATKVETWLRNVKGIRRVIPLLGCNSHRLNLAVNQFLSIHDNLVQKVHELMVALKHPKNRIRLASAVVLTPEIDQSTRWGSTYTMLDKYLRLYPHFVECGFPEETKRLIPHFVEHEEIITLTEQLKEFQIISKWLQSADGAIQINGENTRIPVNHFNIRTSFDSLIDRYPCMERHLAKNASIVHSPDFENAIAKMQGNLPFSRLSLNEKKAIEFYVESAVEEKESDSDEGVPPAFASIVAMASAQAEAEQRVKRSRINGQIRPMRHLSPTSNIVERLFSNAKLIMTDQRRKMDPSTLETILMLKLNKDLWDARDIERLRRQKADERAAERRASLPSPMLSTPAPSGGSGASSSSSASQSRILDDCDGNFF